MDNLIKNTASYLDFLKNECNLLISLHFDADFYAHIGSKALSLIRPYNVHTNPYCIKIKSNAHSMCLENQKTILKKCKKNEGFVHICHGGVSEFIYPIFHDNAPIGYISFSGYNSVSDSFNPHLKKEIPTFLSSLAPPLALMVEYLLSNPITEPDSEYGRILQFLSEYHVNVGLKELSEHFGKSKSHISHLFKSKSGMTIRAYCNALKLEDSKTLLLTTDYSITDIALDLGFSDTSYFISLFKKKYGISPLKYRKKLE